MNPSQHIPAHFAVVLTDYHVDSMRDMRSFLVPLSNGCFLVGLREADYFEEFIRVTVVYDCFQGVIAHSYNEFCESIRGEYSFNHLNCIFHEESETIYSFFTPHMVFSISLDGDYKQDPRGNALSFCTNDQICACTLYGNRLYLLLYSENDENADSWKVKRDYVVMACDMSEFHECYQGKKDSGHVVEWERYCEFRLPWSCDVFVFC